MDTSFGAYNIFGIANSVYMNYMTHYMTVYMTLAQKKLPKWLRNICLTKKCVFSDFENIAHCCYNGFEEDIYIYEEDVS